MSWSNKINGKQYYQHSCDFCDRITLGESDSPNDSDFIVCNECCNQMCSLCQEEGSVTECCNKEME